MILTDLKQSTSTAHNYSFIVLTDSVVSGSVNSALITIYDSVVEVLTTHTVSKADISYEDNNQLLIDVPSAYFPTIDNSTSYVIIFKINYDDANDNPIITAPSPELTIVTIPQTLVLSDPGNVTADLDANSNVTSVLINVPRADALYRVFVGYLDVYDVYQLNVSDLLTPVDLTVTYVLEVVAKENSLNVAVQEVVENVIDLNEFQTISAISNTVSAPYVDTPELPRDFLASYSYVDQIVTLTWESPLFDWLFPGVNYTISRKVNSGSFVFLATVLDSEPHTYEDNVSALDVGDVITYQIINTANVNGYPVDSSSVSSDSITIFYVPSAPDALTVSGIHDDGVYGSETTVEGIVNISFKNPVSIGNGIPTEFVVTLTQGDAVFTDTVIYIPDDSDPDNDIYYVTFKDALILPNVAMSIDVLLKITYNTVEYNGATASDTLIISGVPVINITSLTTDLISFNVLTYSHIGKPQYISYLDSYGLKQLLAYNTPAEPLAVPEPTGLNNLFTYVFTDVVLVNAEDVTVFANNNSGMGYSEQIVV